MANSSGSPLAPSLAPPLALTMGEPGGIGPELSFKARTALLDGGPPFFVVGDPAAFAPHGDAIALIASPAETAARFKDALPVLDIGISSHASVGRAAPQSAKAVIVSIEKAVAFALSGDAAAVVTNPIQKASLFAAGFKFPGHTELLEALTASAPMPKGAQRGAVMMLAGPALRTVPVTIHQSVIAAARALTTEMIVQKGLILADALERDFGIAAPRIAVSGLNPHAGENGAIGDEDARIIAPAIRKLAAAGVKAFGPLPADTMFHEDARATYDAALCMLHDQALIPAKTLAFHEAVNVTLGLPIVRTSPDHGTALDIAGKGVARPDSLIAALRMASTMAARRRAAQ